MFQGRDFLEVVRLLEPSPSSASMRARIGRFYYAAFLESRAHCERALGYQRARMAREHQAVANLIASADPVIADAVKDLRIARNAADYDDQLDHDSIRELLERAESLGPFILQGLESLRNRP